MVARDLQDLCHAPREGNATQAQVPQAELVTGTQGAVRQVGSHAEVHEPASLSLFSSNRNVFASNPLGHVVSTGDPATSYDHGVNRPQSSVGGSMEGTAEAASPCSVSGLRSNASQNRGTPNPSAVDRERQSPTAILRE